ncbi:MAG: hypothetical protein ACOX6T_21500 [Myxococcales bacterium]|jgi:DNA-directed RNA polymerase specialized sigma24 family protein
MSDTQSKEERLFLALRSLRGEETGLSRRQAQAIIGEVVPSVVKSGYSRWKSDASDLIDEAVANAIEKACFEPFRGNTPAAAVSFVRACAFNYVASARRQAKRMSQVPLEEAPEPVQDAPGLEALDDEWLLGRIDSLYKRILIKAARKRERARVFLDYRLGRSAPLPARPQTDEERRARDVTYTARYKGRAYVAEILEQMAPELDELDRLIGAKLVSEAGDDGRPQSKGEEMP